MWLDNVLVIFALVISFTVPIVNGQMQHKPVVPVATENDSYHPSGIQTIIEYVDDTGRQLVLDVARKISVDASTFHFLSAELSSEADIEKLRRSPHIRSVEHNNIDEPIFEAVPFVDYADDTDSDDGGNVNRERQIEEMIPEAVTMIQAHQLDLGSDAPTICICDSGYALGHPDLPQPPQVQGTNMVLNNGRVLKWDEDHTGHGTESASIIAAVEGNGQGLRGASPGVRLHITRGLDDDKRSTVSQMFRAIQQCVEAGAQIINLSLGCPCEEGDEANCRSTRCISDQMERYFDNLAKSGILVVAAAGNQGREVAFYPASYPSVVSVGAANRQLAKFRQSNSNPHVELMGLGFAVNVLGVENLNTYSFSEKTSGTSVATSAVAAAAALLWSHFPQCNVTQIRTALGRTAINTNGCDINIGFGMVQVKDAHDLLITEGCELDGRLYHGGVSCDAEFLKTKSPTGTSPTAAPSYMHSESPSSMPTLSVSESPTGEPTLSSDSPANVPTEMPTVSSTMTEEPTVSDLNLMSSIATSSTSDATTNEIGLTLLLSSSILYLLLL